ncbi:MAG: hypothetical protein U0S48_18555 [Solirubrobacteraceae bacterium]
MSSRPDAKPKGTARRRRRISPVGARGLENVWKPITRDPWGRWAPGEEPVRELEITGVVADDSDTLMIRQPRVDIAPGVIPDPYMDPDLDNGGEDDWELQFVGRWNVRWSGNRITDLSLDLFCDEVDEVMRLRFLADEPLDLLLVYNAAFVGIRTLTVCNEGTPARNARDKPLGHPVICRDPLLAMQIAARCYGVARHFDVFQAELWHPSEIKSEKGREVYEELTAAASTVRGEPATGLQRALDDDMTLRAIAAMHGDDSDRSGLIYNEPIATTLDAYTLIGTMGLGFIDDDTHLARVPEPLAMSLGANVTFADAISAIRRVDPAGLPLWLDFTSDEDERPAMRRHPSGVDQPLYGALVVYEDDPEHGGPFHAVVPIGRTVNLDPFPLATGVLAIGPDDRWRWPMPDNQLGLITAHRGGVVVRNTTYSYELDGVEPKVTREWVRREIAGHFASTSEWVLARVGAILTGLDDGLLHLRRTSGSRRTFDLELAPAAAPRARRAGHDLDPWHLARRLRELGSMRRVADELDADIAAVRATMQAAGIDPDQVRRDEVLTRYRATGSIDAIGLPIFRAEIERFLRDAGIDPHDTPVPHDVTDPEALEAIAAYRAAGTLDAAGAHLGISGESVRRRIARTGLRVEDIETNPDRRQREESVAAFHKAGRSLAGAARLLGIDPRTVRDRLARVGVDPAATPATGKPAGTEELRDLYALVGSIRQVAALAGVSVEEVRRAVGPCDRGQRRGRRVSDDALDQAEMAYREHGSVRAAARALALSAGTFQYRLKQAQARHGP